MIAAALLLDLVAPGRRERPRVIRYLSLCSGIEAATSAWHRLGWQPVAFCEIEKFPAAVLKHHYPKVPNFGDMTKWREWPEELLASVDVLVGGTPCQAFSVAGLRNSLSDERGNLTLVYAHIVARIDELRAARGLPPVICVWENVPGVLTTRDNAFGCFLGALAGEDEALVPAGRKWTNAGFVSGPERSIAWRILDAQWFGVAQRRRRVFVVGSARTGFRPEQVLFEFDGLRRDSPPGREARQVAPTLPARSTAGGGLGTDFDCDGGVIGGGWPAEIAPTLNACFGEKQGLEDQHINGGGGMFVPSYWDGGQVSQTLDAVLAKGQTMPEKNRFPAVLVPMVVHGTQDSCSQEDLTFPLGRNSGQENVVAFDTTQITSKENRSNPQPGDPCHPLASGAHPPAIAIQERAICENPNAGPDGVGVRDDDCAYTLEARQVPQAVAFETRCAGNGRGMPEEVVPPLKASSGETGKGDAAPCVATATAVRRLTPRECERLQGFPDDFTLIPWRGKPASECPDGPRYKALGNSMAVPVMRWIGERIEMEVAR